MLAVFSNRDKLPIRVAMNYSFSISMDVYLAPHLHSMTWNANEWHPSPPKEGSGSVYASLNTRYAIDTCLRSTVLPTYTYSRPLNHHWSVGSHGTSKLHVIRLDTCTTCAIVQASRSVIECRRDIRSHVFLLGCLFDYFWQFYSTAYMRVAVRSALVTLPKAFLHPLTADYAMRWTLLPPSFLDQ